MHSRVTLVGFFIAIAVAVVAVFFFYAAHSQGAEAAPASSADYLAAILPQEAGLATSSPAAPAEQARAGYLEYKNQRYHISLLYPKDLQVGFTDEGAGSGAITFQDADAAQGFQIYVTPYTGDRMFDDRFKRDVPSGVQTDVNNVTVGGVQATGFYSTDSFLGDTREVWF